jgi:hypothetical protein
MPAGCVEIDPPAGGKSEAAQVAAEGAQSGSGDDSERFAEGLARAVGAAKKKGSNVIDGRSERVKQRDSKRDGAH